MKTYDISVSKIAERRFSNFMKLGDNECLSFLAIQIRGIVIMSIF